MTTTKVKTSELVGAALDWAVAKAAYGKEPWQLPYELLGTWYAGECSGGYKDWEPSTDWSQGGPLIEKYSIAFRVRAYEVDAIFDAYSAFYIAPAKNHLVAACRAIVAAKLGDTVSVPAELVEAKQ